MLRKLVKLALIALYALVFGELFFRAMAPQPLMPRYVTDGGDGIRQNIAGAVYRQKTPEVNVEIRINQAGLRRDSELPHEKASGTTRIVLLGDSFFMGYEVDLENSLAYLIEKDLNAAGFKTEVVNLAISGFGTAEHLIALQKRGRSFQPDIVVMQWHDSDPTDNIRSGLFMVERPGSLELKPAAEKFLPGIKTRAALMKIPGYEWLIGNSHLYSAVRERAANKVKDFLLELKRLKASPPPSKGSEANNGPKYHLDEALILAVKNAANGMGAQLVLFDVPTKTPHRTYFSAFNRLDRDLLGGVKMVSPAKALLDARKSGHLLYFERGHGHWTPEGNRIASSVLVKELRKMLANTKMGGLAGAR